MPFDVTMPDGTTIRGVPDGTTKSQLMAKFQKMSPAAAPAAPAMAPKAAPSLPNAENTAPIAANPAMNKPVAPAAAPAEESGILERIMNDISARHEMGKKIMTTPGQNPASVGLQMAGKVVAGTAGDIASEVLKPAAEQAIEVAKQAQPVAALLPGMNKYDRGMQVLLNAGMEKLQKGKLAYVDWAKNHPEAAANIESVVDIASFIPAVKATNALAKSTIAPLGELTPVTGPMLKGMKAPTVEMRRSKATGDIKKLQGNIETAKNAGENIIPALATDMKRQLTGLVDTSKPSLKAANPGSLEAIDRLNKLVDTGQTDLKSLIVERNTLTDLVKKGGEDGATAKKVRNAIDNAIEQSDTKNTKLYGESMDKYRMAKAYEDMANKFNPVMNNPKAIKARAEVMLGSKSFQYLPEEVKKTVRAAAKGKTSGNIIAGATSFINALPIVGQASGMAIGLVTKPVVRNIAKGSVEDIFRSIEKAGKKGKTKAFEQATDAEAMNPTVFPNE